jgi:phage tail-like protein
MKRKILFAIFGVVMFLVGTSSLVMGPHIQTLDYARSSDFNVYIDGEQVPNILKVENLGVNVEIVDVGVGPDNVRQAVPGAGEVKHVDITGFLTKDTSIQDWVMDTYNGKDIRKDITVEVMGPKKDTIRTFNLHDCWPTSFEILDLDAEDKSETVKFTFTVKVNRIEIS